MLIEKIHWLGHASFRIDTEKIIYIDPWNIKNPIPADIILFTHSHFDHFSQSDIKKIQKIDTTFVGPADCLKSLKGTLKIVKPQEKIQINGITIETVPAYNIGKSFHPKGNNWLGYLVMLGGEVLYHAGDTDFIPEMKSIKTDIALVPIGGTYTMDAQEAATAANTIKPKIVIPMHFGSIVGSDKDLQIFKDNCQIELKVLHSEA